MNEESLNKYKQMLLDEKQTLEKELEEIGVKNKIGDWEAVPEKTEQEADENDLADKFEDYEERSAMLNSLEDRYNSIESALGKIESDPGSYGVCSVCHNPISTERLDANPAAKTCKIHMEKSE